MNGSLGTSPRVGGEAVACRRIFRRLKKQWVGTITHVNTDSPVAAITFDDGPHQRYTRELLTILKKHHAQATFFMVGQAANQHPELVRLVFQSGHTIGNHTFCHTALPTVNLREKIRELRQCQRALRPYGSHLLRLPWGKQSNGSRMIARLLGYRVFSWNLTAEDWRFHSSRSMAGRLAAGLRAGSIILLHDRIFKSIMDTPRYDRSETLEAVDLFLAKTSGTFRFVTIPQLMKYGKPNYVI